MQIDRIFIISCPYFRGFKISVDINQYESIDGIVDHVLTMLKETLSQISLEALIHKLDTNKSNYHIHDFEFGHMFINPGPYYICNNCEIDSHISNFTGITDDMIVEATIVPETSEVNNDTINSLGVGAIQNEDQLIPLNHEEDKDTSSNPIDNILSMYNSLVNNNYTPIESTDDTDYKNQ